MAMNGEFYFAKSHEWISKNVDNKFYVGISDFAQSELGDVVYVSFPEAGKTYEKGDKIGEIESVKSVSEIYAPVSLKIISVNSKLNDSPELINQQPYDAGFVAEVEALDSSNMDGLMDKNAYESFITSIHE